MRRPQERRRSRASPWLARRLARDAGDRVEEDVEAARGHHPGVEALHRARRRVPRVREGLLLRPLPLAVDGLEPRPRQVHLPSRLELARHVVAPEDERDRADRPRVRRDVVPAHAVAPGHRPHELPALVVEGHREAVDLELGGVGDLLLPDHPEDPLLELRSSASE